MCMMHKTTIIRAGVKTTAKKGQWFVFYESGKVLSFKNKAFHRRYTSAGSLHIYSSGNGGTGTSPPVFDLNVEGNVAIDGTLYVDKIESTGAAA